MKHLLSILIAAILCATASAQTIRTLGYNTNGQVVYTGTNTLTFINSVAFGDDAGISFGGSAAATTRANLGFSTNLNTLWTATTASNARSAVGLGATWLTNTNVTNFRTAVGVGTNDFVTFKGAYLGSALYVPTNFAVIEITAPIWIGETGTNDVFQFEVGEPDQAKARANLGLPLSALTNTSNVTMMRALAGSTNTNHPFSGSISVVGTNNTNTLVFSNGILQSVQ